MRFARLEERDVKVKETPQMDRNRNFVNTEGQE